MDKIQILEALRRYKKFKTQAEFANFLDITPQAISKWYKRNTYNIDILSMKFPEINPRWLILGEGEMFVSPTTQIAVDIAGDNQQLNNVQVSSEAITSLVNTLNKIVEANSRDMMKKNEQIDRLLGIIETEQKNCK